MPWSKRSSKKTPAQRQLALRKAIYHAVSHGLTSVQTMDLREGSWQKTLADYKEVLKDLPIFRVYHQCNFMHKASFEEFIKEGYHTGVSDDLHKIGPLKLFIDGSLGARTALMRSPYHDDPSTSGIATLSQDELDELVMLADAHKIKVATHAIGDGGIEMVIDSYAKVTGKLNDLRHAIIHVRITDQPLLQRMADLDILAKIQPIFLHYDTSIVEDRVGKKLASTSYAFASMHRLGMHVSLGTDSPVEDLDPFANIYCAITRKNLNGEPQDGFYKEEALTLTQAIDDYTIGSAYDEFIKLKKGRLKEGHLADLVILDQDLFDIAPKDILKTKVLATMVDGNFVYEA